MQFFRKGMLIAGVISAHQFLSGLALAAWQSIDPIDADLTVDAKRLELQLDSVVYDRADDLSYSIEMHYLTGADRTAQVYFVVLRPGSGSSFLRTVQDVAARQLWLGGGIEGWSAGGEAVAPLGRIAYERFRGRGQQCIGWNHESARGITAGMYCEAAATPLSQARAQEVLGSIRYRKP